MRDIKIEVIEDDNIEQCKILCNELMALQKSKAMISPECFDYMTFDTRMKPSFEQASARQVIVAKDKGVPIAYVFSVIEHTEDKLGVFPDWVAQTDTENMQGFYPDWDDLPKKIGCLNNIFIKDEYRSLGLGSRLFNQAMAWLESFDDVDVIFIYVSNGNDDALKFYANKGFQYSHDVFGGFITAMYKIKNQ